MAKGIRGRIRHQLVRARNNADNCAIAMAVVDNIYLEHRPDLCVQTRLIKETAQQLRDVIQQFLDSQP